MTSSTVFCGSALADGHQPGKHWFGGFILSHKGHQGVDASASNPPQDLVTNGQVVMLLMITVHLYEARNDVTHSYAVGWNQNARLKFYKHFP